MTTLAHRIQAALASRDMNGSDLARRTGVSRQTVSRWINGITTPPTKRVYQIAEATSHPVAYFLPEVRRPQHATLVVRRDGAEVYRTPIDELTTIEVVP